MVDFNNYLSGEVRQIAFRKSTEQDTWQEAVQQSHKVDADHWLSMLAKGNILAGMANKLSIHIHEWRQNRRQASPQMTGLPSQPRPS